MFALRKQFALLPQGNILLSNIYCSRSNRFPPCPTHDKTIVSVTDKHSIALQQFDEDNLTRKNKPSGTVGINEITDILQNLKLTKKKKTFNSKRSKKIMKLEPSGKDEIKEENDNSETETDTSETEEVYEEDDYLNEEPVDSSDEENEEDENAYKSPCLFEAHHIAVDLKVHPFTRELFNVQPNANSSTNIDQVINYYRGKVYNYKESFTSAVSYLYSHQDDYPVNGETIKSTKQKESILSPTMDKFQTDDEALQQLELERSLSKAKMRDRVSNIDEPETIEEDEDDEPDIEREVRNSQRAYDNMNHEYLDPLASWCGLFGRFKNPITYMLCFVMTLYPAKNAKNKQKRTEVFLNYIHTVAFSFYLHANNRFLCQFVDLAPFAYDGVGLTDTKQRQEYTHANPSHLFMISSVGDFNDGSASDHEETHLKNFGDVVRSARTTRYLKFFCDLIYSLKLNDTAKMFDHISMDCSNACVIRFKKNAMVILDSSKFKQHRLVVPVEHPFELTEDEEFQIYKLREEEFKEIAQLKQTFHNEDKPTENESKQVKAIQCKWDDKKIAIVKAQTRYQKRLGTIDVALNAFLKNHCMADIKALCEYEVKTHPAAGRGEGLCIGLGTIILNPVCVQNIQTSKVKNTKIESSDKYTTQSLHFKVDRIAQMYSHIGMRPHIPVLQIINKDVDRLFDSGLKKGERNKKNNNTSSQSIPRTKDLNFEILLTCDEGDSERTKVVNRLNRIAYQLACFMTKSTLSKFKTGLNKKDVCGKNYFYEDYINNSPHFLEYLSLMYCHYITPRVIMLLEDKVLNHNFQEPRFLEIQPMLSMICTGKVCCYQDSVNGKKGNFIYGFPSNLMQEEDNGSCEVHRKLQGCLSVEMYNKVIKVYRQLVIDTSIENFQRVINVAKKDELGKSDSLTKVDVWHLYILLVCLLDVEEDVYATLAYLRLPILEYYNCVCYKENSRLKGPQMTPPLVNLYNDLVQQSIQHKADLAATKRDFSRFRIKRDHNDQNKQEHSTIFIRLTTLLTKKYKIPAQDEVFTTLLEFKDANKHSFKDLYHKDTRKHWMQKMFSTERISFILAIVLEKLIELEPEFINDCLKTISNIKKEAPMFADVINMIKGFLYGEITPKSVSLEPLSSEEKIVYAFLAFVYRKYNKLIRAFLLLNYPEAENIKKRESSFFLKPNILAINNTYNSFMKILCNRSFLSAIAPLNNGRSFSMDHETKSKVDALSAAGALFCEMLNDKCSEFKLIGNTLKKLAPNFQQPDSTIIENKLRKSILTCVDRKLPLSDITLQELDDYLIKNDAQTVKNKEKAEFILECVLGDHDLYKKMSRITNFNHLIDSVANQDSFLIKKEKFKMIKNSIKFTSLLTSKLGSGLTVYQYFKSKLKQPSSQRIKIIRHDNKTIKQEQRKQVTSVKHEIIETINNENNNSNSNSSHDNMNIETECLTVPVQQTDLFCDAFVLFNYINNDIAFLKKNKVNI